MSSSATSPQQPEKGRQRCYYDKHAQDVKLSEITSNSENATVIRKLRTNDLKDKQLTIKDDGRFEFNDYININQDDDLGWLGYFIGKSETLQKLTLCCWPDEKERVDAAAFAEGIYRNQSIQMLEFYSSTAFQNVISCRNNGNLTDLSLCCNIGGEVAQSLALALGGMSLKLFHLEHNSLDSNSFDTIIKALISQTQLERLHVMFNAIDRRGCETLSDLLVSWRPQNLRELVLGHNHINDEGLRCLIPGISECCNLRWLGLTGNEFVTSVGLRSLFEEAVIRNLNGLSLGHILNITEGLDHLVWRLPNFQALQYLELEDTDIDDEELQTLSMGIATYLSSVLRELDLSDNPYITADGLRSLSTLLQSESCCLEVLRLHNMDMSDENASALADALVGNTSLEKLVINEPTSSSGWSAFSRLLCDTSSISNTHCSNHTLTQIHCHGYGEEVPSSVERYLEMNKYQEHVATTKILMHHPVFNMETFFQWKLKFLPVLLAWFHEAMSVLILEELTDGEGYRLPFGYLVGELLSECDTSKLESVDHVSQACDVLLTRKLSSVYQFVRAMPLLVVDGYCSQDLTRGSRKRKRILQQSGKMSNGRKRACSF